MRRQALQCVRSSSLAMRAAPLSSSCQWDAVWREEKDRQKEKRGAPFEFVKLPKVELHRHLEGAVRLRTILEEARRHHIDHLPGVSLQDTKQLFEYFDMTESGVVTVEEFTKACKEMGMADVTNEQARLLIKTETHGAKEDLNFKEFEHLLEVLMLAELRPYVLTDKPFPNLKSLLDRFDRTQLVFKDEETFTRIAFEAVEDAFNEGIRLLELRYAPSFCSMGHDHAFNDVLKAIQKGVRQAKQLYDIEAQKRWKKTVDFLLENRDAFVGFDLAGAETELTQWTAPFRRVRDAGIPITCHASEDKDTGHPFNAVKAIEELGASRIGHGVQIIQDPRAMEAVKAHDVLLEISVSSNYLCGCFPMGAHPARTLWNFGIPLCVNTDDPGIMSLDLQGEYRLWHDELGFDGAELKETNKYAVERSFLPQKARQRVMDKYFK